MTIVRLKHWSCAQFGGGGQLLITVLGLEEIRLLFSLWLQNKLETLNVSHIESVRACRKKPRDVPRAFEIFTDDGASYKFKSNDHKNVERWVQCLNLALSKQRKPGRYHTVG